MRWFEYEFTQKRYGRSFYGVLRRFGSVEAARWDQTSFDPDYDTLPLEHFEPMVHRLFAREPRGYG